MPTEVGLPSASLCLFSGTFLSAALCLWMECRRFHVLGLGRRVVVIFEDIIARYVAVHSDDVMDLIGFSEGSSQNVLHN